MNNFPEMSSRDVGCSSHAKDPVIIEKSMNKHFGTKIHSYDPRTSMANNPYCRQLKQDVNKIEADENYGDNVLKQSDKRAR
ncbi:hypothetical protein RO3G_07929 [Rhizopus delemar RA 99-880]|uniref:Uncharacterized protein n=1 Tax=Rhizopus delemar (strain RA 99-880 / ATCC MYA-4621 / FGSC 9543 / NRRL 43880) TaxID=246409 RepID=I1C444_RHIO9|nr:hypothetical protein RO3G_07929 [Rhizopus delemar RA 99-880]|eukprot:EIE83224.1 hypothetical protein RO3G_07929 [Rhizopus delemar RA 99-880]